MSCFAFIQARLTSSRFPRKIIQPIFNSLDSLDILYSRIQSSELLDSIYFVIPDNDEELVDIFNKKKLPYLVGPETDVLSRYVYATQKLSPSVVVRLTSDCPLVDPQHVDYCISRVLYGGFDYFSNNTPPDLSTFANGSDVEVFTSSLLYTVSNNFIGKRDREHVTFPMWDGRLNITKGKMHSTRDNSDVRITLDYSDDLEVIASLLKYLDYRKATYSDIIKAYRYLKLDRLNSHHHYSEGWK